MKYLFRIYSIFAIKNVFAPHFSSPYCTFTTGITAQLIIGNQIINKQTISLSFSHITMIRTAPIRGKIFGKNGYIYNPLTADKILLPNIAVTDLQIPDYHQISNIENGLAKFSPPYFLQENKPLLEFVQLEPNELEQIIAEIQQKNNKK